jgi:single-strand DNA-binding protein
VFDTFVTIVGNVITLPEWRRVEKTSAVVAHFKVASNARRFDKDSGRWVDGNSLRVRVNCWRKLAEGVLASVMIGDPVIVTGRLYTRDWTGEDGQRRSTYEMEAVAVGHDLARGRGKFQRSRPNTAVSVVEDADTDARVGGELSASVPELNDKYRAAVAEDFDEEPPPFDEPAAPDDSLEVLRAAGFEPVTVAAERDGAPLPETATADLGTKLPTGNGGERPRDRRARGRVAAPV